MRKVDNQSLNTGLQTSTGVNIYNTQYLRSEHFSHTKDNPKYNWWKVFWDEAKATFYVHSCEEPNRVFPLWVYLKNCKNEKVFDSME